LSVMSHKARVDDSMIAEKAQEPLKGDYVPRNIKSCAYLKDEPDFKVVPRLSLTEFRVQKPVRPFSMFQTYQQRNIEKATEKRIQSTQLTQNHFFGETIRQRDDFMVTRGPPIFAENFYLFKHKLDVSRAQQQEQIDKLKLKETKKQQKLKIEIEKRLKIYGHTLNPEVQYMQTQSKIPDPTEARDFRDLQFFYPNVFLMQDLHPSERKALYANFNLHKRLFRYFFNKYSVFDTHRYISQNELIQKRDSIMSLKMFADFVKDINPDFQHYSYVSLTNIFKFATHRVIGNQLKTYAATFEYFSIILFLFCFDFYRSKGLTNSPLHAFNLFLEHCRQKVEKKMWFDNDFILALNCDPQLIIFYTKKLLQDQNVELPKHFVKKTRIEYLTEQPEEVPESEKMAKEMLGDILSAAIGILPLNVKITERQRILIKQVNPIDHELNASCKVCETMKAPKENKDNIRDLYQSFNYHNSAKFIATGRNLSMAKSMLSPFGLQTSNLNSSVDKPREISLVTPVNPIEGLSLSLKLMIVNDDHACRKQLIEVAGVMENLLKRASLLANVPLSKINDEGMIINSVKQQKIQRQKEQERLQILEKENVQKRKQSLQKRLEVLKKFKSDKALEPLKPTQTIQNDVSRQMNDFLKTQKDKLEVYRQKISQKKSGKDFNAGLMSYETKLRLQQYEKMKELRKNEVNRLTAELKQKKKIV